MPELSDIAKNHEKIVDLGRNDPIVQQSLMLHWHHGLTYEQALEVAVLTLAETNEANVQKAITCAQEHGLPGSSVNPICPGCGESIALYNEMAQEEPSYVEGSVPDRIVGLMRDLGFKLKGELDAEHMSRTRLVFTEETNQVFTTVTIEDTMEPPKEIDDADHI